MPKEKEPQLRLFWFLLTAHPLQTAVDEAERLSQPTGLLT